MNDISIITLSGVVVDNPQSLQTSDEKKRLLFTILCKNARYEQEYKIQLFDEAADITIEKGYRVYIVNGQFFTRTFKENFELVVRTKDRNAIVVDADFSRGTMSADMLPNNAAH